MLDNTNNEALKQRYDGLQVLRAAAALIVLFYHVGHTVEKEIGTSLLTNFLGWERWGIAGVLLFFSISGFVISEAAERTTPFLFLLDRARRIYPGYFLAVFATIALKLTAYGSFPWSAYSLSSLTLLPLGIRDYVLGVEWTLTYEIAFYLITSSWLLISSPRTLWILALIWILVIIVANFYFSGSWQNNSLTPELSSVLISGFCIPFCMGLICHRARHFLAFVKWPFTLAAGAFYGIYALSTSTSLSILALTFAGSILIMVMVNSFNLISTPSASSALLWIGNRSYGIYLFHVPLISTITLAILKKIMPTPTVAAFALIFICLAGATLFAIAEYKLYKYSRRISKRALRPA